MCNRAPTYTVLEDLAGFVRSAHRLGLFSPPKLAAFVVVFVEFGGLRTPPITYEGRQARRSKKTRTKWALLTKTAK